MFTTVWEYEVGPAERARFVETYGPEGSWVALFRTAPGYRGTALLQDLSDPARFVTIDRWDSRAAYTAFRASQAEAYASLDEQTAGLTRAERHVGEMEYPEEPS